jgi:hypothetical protein
LEERRSGREINEKVRRLRTKRLWRKDGFTKSRSWREMGLIGDKHLAEPKILVELNNPDENDEIEIQGIRHKENGGSRKQVN